MTIRIEIQEQPERARFWAEVEVGSMIARRKELTSPKADGLAGILRMVHEAAAAMDPRLKAPVDDVVRHVAVPEGAAVVAWDAQGDPSAWPGLSPSQFNDAARASVVDAGLDALRAESALRAEAEAAGVRVDGRWGTERLRKEIASVGHAVRDNSEIVDAAR